MRLLFPLLFASCALAQMTTVTGSIAGPTEDPLNWTCSIQAAAPFSASGYRIIGAPIQVKFTAGILRVKLLPTDTVTSPPGMYYRVQCSAPLQTINGRSAGPYTSPTWTWTVPTSSSPVDISTLGSALLNVIGLGALWLSLGATSWVIPGWMLNRKA